MTDLEPMEIGAAEPGSALSKWETFTTIPMLILSVAWIVLITMFVVYEPGHPNRVTIGIALAGIWVLFIFDYALRFGLAKHKKVFLKESVLDLGSVVIPVLRPFHLLTYLKGIKAFRRPTPAAFRTRLAVWGVSFAVLFIYTIALFVFEAERGAPGANINSLGNSVWWAIVTIATVGYGDYYPVTIAGRIAATALMIGGVAIVGTTSAIVISVLNERLTKMAKAHHGRVEESLTEIPVPAETKPSTK